jgi:predicted GNAT superfamily acetyltransferase
MAGLNCFKGFKAKANEVNHGLRTKKAKKELEHNAQAFAEKPSVESLQSVGNSAVKTAQHGAQYLKARLPNDVASFTKSASSSASDLTKSAKEAVVPKKTTGRKVADWLNNNSAVKWVDKKTQFIDRGFERMGF